jgi:hypothetical protein
MRGLLSIVVCIAAVGMWLLLRDDSAEHSIITQAATPGVELTRPKPFSMTQLYAAAQDKVDGTVSPPVKDITTETTFDEAVAELLRSDPGLREFYELRRKALRTSVEQQAYLDLISDPRLIDEAGAELLAGAAKPMTPMTPMTP